MRNIKIRALMSKTATTQISALIQENFNLLIFN